MTEEHLRFIEECEKETAEQFNKFLNDEKFINDRIQELVDMMVKTTKKSAELEESGASDEKIREAQKGFLIAMSENQLNSLKVVYDEQAESRYVRVKKLSQLDLDVFREVSFEVIKRELAIMTKFSQEMLAKAEQPLMEALNKLEEEEFKNSDEVGVPIFNIDQTKTVN